LRSILLWSVACPCGACGHCGISKRYQSHFESEADDPDRSVRRQQTTLPHVIAIGGGVPIKVGNDVIGGVGLSGSPGVDEPCVNAGIDNTRCWTGSKLASLKPSAIAKEPVVEHAGKCARTTAPSAPLRSQDTLWKAVPIPGRDRQKAMPHARWRAWVWWA
jgi:hypothetical protein